MSGMEKLLVFALAGLPCALGVAEVDKVLPAVAISAVPQAPAIVLGLINVHGRILPVLDIRRLFRLPAIETAPEHRLIIARTATRPVALIVDEVLGVAEQGDVVPPRQLYPGIEYLRGVTRIGEGIAYIYDLETFLSSADDAEIERLLAAGMPRPDQQNT